MGRETREAETMDEVIKEIMAEGGMTRHLASRYWPLFRPYCVGKCR
jgi:hypothetical protein